MHFMVTLLLRFIKVTVCYTVMKQLQERASENMADVKGQATLLCLLQQYNSVEWLNGYESKPPSLNIALNR